jgi:aspartyl-tRNA(Asn)/glutamyl-tRNA(Gln) amidotransferase subunit A
MRGRVALLTPMLPITARPVDDVDETTFPLATWSRAVNYLLCCAIALPAKFTGLPAATQIVAPAARDSCVTHIADLLQVSPPRSVPKHDFARH